MVVVHAGKGAKSDEEVEARNRSKFVSNSESHDLVYFKKLVITGIISFTALPAGASHHLYAGTSSEC
jgi:hypothetical protein